jgi:hypothetical protein
MLGIFLVTEQLVASQETLNAMESVAYIGKII